MPEYTYKIGNYIQLEYFHRIFKEESGLIFIYCGKAATKNAANKFSGEWYLYVFSTETEKWHPLVKVDIHTKRMSLKVFTTVDGVINSINRFNLPISAITTIKGSGCEISSAGHFHYRPQCVLIQSG